MNREYHKWHSSALGRDMELLVFGQGGYPLIVFPTSMGRFFDYENRNMIGVIGDKYERGEIQAFCVDSVDAESWYNKAVPPAQRAARHNDYDRYILEEVVPFIRNRNRSEHLVTTGCSFGGYHAINFALRHPDIVTGAVSMSGAFDVKQFLDGYYDDNCYYNCPPDFLPNLNDRWYLDRYNRQRLVLATGETDICLAENLRLDQVMNSKGIPHWLDVWGDGRRSRLAMVGGNGGEVFVVMGRFASAREAKEFLVEKIVDEAQREGVSLSDLERNLLYFSETGWAPAGMDEACARFDSEFDRPEYETKIAQLIRKARERARSEGKHAFAAWSSAIGTLASEDHYLLVMLQEAKAIERPRGDRLRLWTTAFAIVLAGLGLAYLAERLGISLVVFFWGIAVCAAGAYLVFRLIAGRERADKFLNWLLGFFDQRS